MESTKQVQGCGDTDPSESWKPDHAMAMSCFELEEALRQGLQQYSKIRADDERWSVDFEDGRCELDETRLREMRARYERWFVPCDSVLKIVEHYEREYRPIDHSDDFKRARIFVRELLRMPIADVIRTHGLVSEGAYTAI